MLRRPFHLNKGRLDKFREVDGCLTEMQMNYRDWTPNLNKIRLEITHDKQYQKHMKITYRQEDSPLLTDIKCKWVHFLRDGIKFKKSHRLNTYIAEACSRNSTSPGHQTSPWQGS